MRSVLLAGGLELGSAFFSEMLAKVEKLIVF